MSPGLRLTGGAGSGWNPTGCWKGDHFLSVKGVLPEQIQGFTLLEYLLSRYQV